MQEHPQPQVQSPPQPQPVSEHPYTLAVSMGQQYGKKRYYAENELARLFVELTGKTVLSPEQIELIKRLGYRVVLQPRSVPATEL